MTQRGGGPLALEADPADASFTLSPGVRYALNFPSGLQIVPGFAVPVTMRGKLASPDTDTGVLVYLSFEHPFLRRR